MGAVLIWETRLQAGEALALEWNDIDEVKRTLRVNNHGPCERTSSSGLRKQSPASGLFP